MPSVTEYAWNGARRGRGDADRAVLLAHGAGSDLRAPALVAVVRALAAAGVPSLRFNYPYRSAGRRAPDRAQVLLAATREAAGHLARRARLPADRLVLGGRSMGGRYCSLVAADAEDPVPALGLVLLGYPLHAAGRPGEVRAEHFRRLPMPVLFVSGTRDALAGREALRRAARRVKGPVRHCWLEGADHGFRVPKSSGRSESEVLTVAAEATATFVAGLPT